MKEEHKARGGKPGSTKRATTSAAETVENQPSDATLMRRVNTDRAVFGEYFFQGRRVRTIAIDGETWFFASDVCEVLEIANPRDALARLEPDERGVANTDTLGGPQTVNVINESGLYSLVFTSRKSEARAFRRWVTAEVLPAIRRTGSYSMTGSDDNVITLARLDVPVRYIVMSAPGRPPHVRQMPIETILAERTKLDCEGLCYALKAIEVWWHKVQQRESVGGNPRGGFARARLDRAIIDGACTANQYLWVNQTHHPAAAAHETGNLSTLDG